ncbi:hypothetical protein CR513_39919, partial [Mucuna pruriens]
MKVATKRAGRPSQSEPTPLTFWELPFSEKIDCTPIQAHFKELVAEDDLANHLEAKRQPLAPQAKPSHEVLVRAHPCEGERCITPTFWNSHFPRPASWGPIVKSGANSTIPTTIPRELQDPPSPNQEVDPVGPPRPLCQDEK